MDEQKLAGFKEDFALLVEAGFIAVKQLDEMSARRLFNAAQMLNPESTAPQIGLGYIALNKLEIKIAAPIFEKVLEKEPENHLAQTFLGITLLLDKSKRKKGEKLIKEAIEKTTEKSVKDLGKLSLEWAETSLKIEKSPFFTEKSKSSSESKENE